MVIGEGDWYPKASMGMHKYESIVRLADEAAFLDRLDGRPLFAVEKERARRELWSEAPYPKDVVFLFGSERFGVPDRLLDAADEIVGIPMYGINHSFPVTVAAGIVLADWARRRYRGALVTPTDR
jgi:tRNA G18 (ribose-2'-O)-methylase SpoU